MPQNKPDITKTYCNPLALPEYPRGMATYAARTPYDAARDSSWRRKEKPHFRETADPTVLYHAGKWYLYPSCGCAYVSEDFITWKHRRMEPYNPGYAPTVVEHRGKFYLTACQAPVYIADNPLGPFAAIGRPTMPDDAAFDWSDPMLFSDDDGRMFAYWGLGKPGIFGAELDPLAPNRLIAEPKPLFSFNPRHAWERFGDWNEDLTINYNEGPWMFKHRDVYYLTYATPGTQWRTYCMAAYVSRKPLGPFKPQKTNPFLRTTDGLIQGPGHGCIVRGPRNSLWAFYTCTVGVNHIFERRIGMDPVGIDAQGDLFSRGASQTPQWAPGLRLHPEKGNNAPLLPVSMNKPVFASSEAPGRHALYAVDNSMRTWWEPAADDAKPEFTVSLESAFAISAIRIIWRDEGLDYDAGVLPGPFAYTIEAQLESGWATIVDKRECTADMLIDYLTFAEIRARAIRLSVHAWPRGIRPALSEITVFGRSEQGRR
jgi:hypothetical protein